jgi:hypothetical protein
MGRSMDDEWWTIAEDDRFLDHQKSIILLEDVKWA